MLGERWLSSGVGCQIASELSVVSFPVLSDKRQIPAAGQQKCKHNSPNHIEAHAAQAHNT